MSEKDKKGLSISQGRNFLKANRWREWSSMGTDQQKGVAYPTLQKEYPKDAELIELAPQDGLTMGKAPLLEVINKRRSRRKYTAEAVSMEELSYLLWTTQGVKEVVREGYASLRTVPSGGARHAFETYLVVKNVTGLEPGLYRYLALQHKLLPERLNDPDLPGKIAAACCDQTFVAMAAVTFVWTVIPYRCEWRYSYLSHKALAIDAGHVGQNLYLACESIGAGTCAIAAYYQEEMDKLIGVDGEDEFVIYVSPVGKI